MFRTYAKRLTELGMKPPKESPLCDISQIESRTGATLPKPFKRFLKQCSGWWGDLCCECEVPTPFGRHNLAGFNDADEIYGLLTSNITPRNMITIASGHLGQFTCLSVAGIDRGAVYALDSECRSRWTDDMFHERFDAIADEIENYLDLRRRQALPEKHDSYDLVYSIAPDFDTFLSRSLPCNAE